MTRRNLRRLRQPRDSYTCGRACVAMLAGVTTLASLILTTAPVPAVAAAQMTVADLEQMCRSSDTVDDAACRYFILGVMEGITLSGSRQAIGHQLCVAPGTSIGELKKAVSDAMTSDLALFPDHGSLAAAGFVVGAAMKAFPCRKGR